MSKQNELVALARTGASGGGSKNMVTNGDMQIAQRGTSATVTTAGTSYDALDRFESYRNSSYAPNYTLSQDTTGPDGFSRSLKVDVDATATPTGSQNFGIRTKVEGFDAVQTGLGTSGSKQITLSFYVKSNKTGTYGTQIFRNGSTAYSTTKGYTIDAADTWERKEITFTAFTTDNTPTVTTAWGIMVHFDLSSGPDDIIAPYDWAAVGAARTVTGQVNLMDSTSNYWQITGVQLEVGDKATDFEHRSFSDELLRCQRYFEKSASPSGGLTDTSAGYINIRDGTASTVVRYYSVRYKVDKRAVPTVTTYDSSSTPNTGKLRRDSTQNVTANVYGSGTSGFNLYPSGSTSHYGVLFGYYVDAEL